jgi:tetratricopeptide (TPR) repeat protein
MDTLLFLLERRGEVVSRDEILRTVWGAGVHVETNSLERQISDLRKILDEGNGGKSHIETVPKRGYRFTAAVVETGADTVPDAPEASRSGLRLRMLLGAALLAILVALFLYAPWHPRVHTRPAVAVLEFRNAGGSQSGNWLSTALSEMFHAELASNARLRTIPGEDVQRARVELSLRDSAGLSQESLARLRGGLGADFLVLGSYVEMGEPGGAQIRIDLELQDVRTGDIVASITRSGNVASLFDLVSEAGTAVNARLGAAGSTIAVPEQGSLPRNPEALRLYSEGIAQLRLYDALAASRLLEDAARADPGSAPIHAALAEAWANLGYLNRAKIEANKAVDLGKGLPRETALGIEARYHEIAREWDDAVRVNQSLWTVFPDDPEHALRLAQAQIGARKGAAALTTIKKLRRTLPQFAADPRIDLTEARAAESLGDPGQELAAAERAMARGHQLGARLLIAQAQLLAASALDNLSRWDEALTGAKSALQTFAQLGDRLSEAQTHKAIGDILDDRSDHVAAEEAYRAAIKLYRTLAHQEGLASSMVNLGHAQRTTGDLDSAEQNFQAAFDVANAIGDTTLQAQALNGLGIIRWRRADLAGAETSFEKSAALLRDSGDQNRLVNVQNNLANVLLDEGYFDDAQKWYEESVALSNQIGDIATAARILGNLGELLTRKGNLTAAKKRFSDQIDLGRKIGADKQVAYGLQGLGYIFLLQREIPQGRSAYQEAIKLRSKLNELGLVAETNLQLAELELYANNIPAAVDAAQKAAAQFQKEQEADQEAQADALLARVLAVAGRQAEAAKAAARASSLLPKIQDVEVHMVIETNLARVKVLEGDPGHARAELQAALDEAYKFTSVPQELEIRGALCEVDAQFCTTELEQTARSRGFLLIADRVGSRRNSALQARR